MIYVVTGENSFEIERELERLIAEFGGAPEKIDGSVLEVRALPDLLMGQSLFAEKRLVILKGLSENKAAWDALPNFTKRVSSDVQLVLVEPKPDKRTKTYKDLQKQAEVKEFKPWSDRDTRLAEQWATREAAELGFKLSEKNAKALVARTGTNQWRIYHALEKLSVLDDVTADIIEEIVEASPTENVFQLFETALSAKDDAIRRQVENLARDEDPYKAFGLLMSQVIQLAALAMASASANQVAKDLGAHPFVLSKLAPFAKRLGAHKARLLLEKAAEIDIAMKTTSTDTWVLVERLLLEANRLATSS